MSLTKTYKEHIINQVLIDYLKQGIIPTSDDFDDAIEEYQASHPDLSQPKLKYQDFDIEYGSFSSASDVEDAAKTISDDIAVVTKEIRNLVFENRRFYERWSYELQRLLSKTKKQEHEIDSLLLLEEDTAGFFAHVSDVFSDTNEVDMSSTTARVNIRETSVVINPDTDHPSGGSALADLSGLTEYDVSFTPLTKRAGTVYSVVSADTQLPNILAPDNRAWLGNVACQTPGQMIGEIKVRLAKKADDAIEASRVYFEYTGANSDNNGATITCQYSIDGYVWYLVPTDFATKALTSVNSWYFPLTNMRWVKLIITKPTHDFGKYTYEFAGRSFKVFGQAYSSTDGNTLITKSRSAEDEEGNAVEFSSLSLETCEEIIDETEIAYYLAASTNNSSWTDWIRITPLNQEGIYSKIISLGNLPELDNYDSIASLDDTIDVLDESSVSGDTAALKVTRLFDNSTLNPNGYKFPLTDEGVVNTAIEIDADVNPNVIANSIVLWRNIYYRAPDDLFAERTVRDVPAGWGIKDGYHYCSFEISDSGGKTFDFGKTTCIIDDQYVSGVVLVPRGVHSFRTLSDYWFDIDAGAETARAAASSVSLNDEATLKSVDPLYPYNHKLILEGFPYPNEFVGEKVYNGADIVAEAYGEKVSLFDLEYNVEASDYSKFAVKSVGTSSYPVLAVIIRFDPNTVDYTDELCRLKWKSGSSLYKYVKLKAVLSTEDSSKTPVLTSYRIKLGL
jgi:hypothetical protein